MCGVTRAGIVENFCVERTALALTKGIALNMGVFTDGVSNNCADEFFTLSFDFNVPPRQFRGNPFTFSNCSAEEIRSFLMNTTSACLRTQSVANPVNVSGIAAEELGQSFVADRQCEDRFGNVSRFCRSLYGISANFTFVDDLCRDMRCSIPGTSSCVGTLPFDATVSIVRTDATTEGTPTPSVVTTTPAPTPIPTIVTTSPAVTTEPAPTLSIFSPSTEPTTPEATLSVFSPSTEPTTPEATLSVFLPSTETTPAPTLSIFSPSTENTAQTLSVAGTGDTTRVTLSVVVPTTPSTGIVGDSG
ncbi:hypothetical protein ACOMHN_022091 [Nucella lapillus]